MNSEIISAGLDVVSAAMTMLYICSLLWRSAPPAADESWPYVVKQSLRKQLVAPRAR